MHYTFTILIVFLRRNREVLLQIHNFPAYSTVQNLDDMKPLYSSQTTTNFTANEAKSYQKV